MLPRITRAPVIKTNESSITRARDPSANRVSESLREKSFHRANSHRQLQEPRSSQDSDRAVPITKERHRANDATRMHLELTWSPARQRATAIVDPRRSTWAPIDQAAVDDTDTPISLMTSVKDFELFHTISAGLRYRRRLACAGSYDKTSAFRSLETTPFRGPRVLSCRPALSSSARARRRET